MKNSSGQKTLEVRTLSADQTQQLASRLALSLQPGDVVLLEGELGAGKTCFVRGLATGLGLSASRVSSPTFVIAHEYQGKQHTLTHIDAYRITSEEDLETIGWTEMLQKKDSVLAIEWPNRIATSLPGQCIEVGLRTISEQERLIRIAVPSERSQLIVNLSAALQTACERQPQPASRCRSCGQVLAMPATSSPFCSDRCRMADLGKWFASRYTVSRPLQNDDEVGG